MENFLDTVARIATVAYAVYLSALLVTAFLGLQLLLLTGLLVLARRAHRGPGVSRPWGARDALALQIVYGFINPLLITARGAPPPALLRRACTLGRGRRRC
jgi:hypothetical protein